MRIASSSMSDVREKVGAQVLAVFSRLAFGWLFIGAIVIGVVLARWTWILFEPSTLSVFPAKAESTEAASATLFGVAIVSGAETPSTISAATADMALIGVFTGKHGFAVFKLDEKTQRGVALGEEITKGVKLLEVHADHAVIERNGARQRVGMESKQANNKSVDQQTSSASAAQAAAGWKAVHHEMQKDL